MTMQRIEGVSLYYEIAGTGQPVLFIHGLGSSTHDWEAQTAAFSKHYRMITFDVRGHGQSEKPPGPYSVPQFSRDTMNLLRALSIESTHVVGLSMGGMIGLQLALDAPELIKTLVVVNSGPYIPQRTFQEKLAVLQRKILFRLFSMRRIGEVIGGRLFPEPHEQELLKTFVERWAQNDKRAYMDATQALLNWDVRDRLSEIRCPVLVVAAELDYTPVELKKEYMQYMSDAQLVVIPKARHAVSASAPEPFNAAVMDFLAQHT